MSAVNRDKLGLVVNKRIDESLQSPGVELHIPIYVNSSAAVGSISGGQRATAGAFPVDFHLRCDQLYLPSTSLNTLSEKLSRHIVAAEYVNT